MKRLLVALVAASLLAVGGWYFFVPVEHEDGAGPLQVGADGYALIDAGIYSFGFQPCTERGRSVDIESVELDKPQGEAEMVGMVQRRRPGGASGVGGVEGFPPSAADVPEAVWEPLGTFRFDQRCDGEPDEVVVGVKLGPNGGVVKGLVVTYRVGGRNYVNHAPIQVVLCGDAVRGLHLLCGG